MDGIVQLVNHGFILETRLISPPSAAQDMENMSEDDGWEFVNLGDQQSFGIKTAGLEEKATACQMLVSGPRRTSLRSTWTLTKGPNVCSSWSLLRCATPKS